MRLGRVHDKRTGNGKSVIRGTETYSGGWKDGEFHGRGVHCDARGNVYDGEVRCVLDGVSLYTYVFLYEQLAVYM